MDRIISGMITMGRWCGVRIVGNVILTTAPLMNLVCSTLMMTGSALTEKGGMAMLERQKVIKGLNCCAHIDGINCIYCPYDNTSEDCTALMSMDALALLKEQETRIKELEEKLRLLEYGDQDILQSGMMPAT